MKRDLPEDVWQATQLDLTRFERATPPETGRVTLRDILTVAFHDRLRIALALLLGLLLTAAVASMVPKKYTAEASLLLRLGREYLYTPEVGDPNAAQPVPYDREQTMLAEAKIMTSHDVIAGVVNTLGAAQIYPGMAALTASPDERNAKATLALQKSLDAELLKGSNLLQVSFKHDNAQTSARVLNEVIEAYLRKRAQVFSSTSNGGAEADVLTRREQMTAIEARLAQFKSERGIRSFAEEQTLLLAQRNAIEQRQSDVGLALAQADGRTQSLNRQLSRIPAEVKLSTETQRGEAAENARKVLLDLKLKEREAGNKFFDGEPAVQDARANLQRANEHLRELETQPPRTTRVGRSAVRDGTESDLVRSTADLLQSKAGSAALAAQRSAINTRLTELATSEDELRTLERERRLTEAQYEAATKRLRDERVSADLDRQRKSNVSVVQRPTVPTEARSLVPVVVVVGGLLSLCAALLVGFLSALWRDTFITPSEVQRGLGVPLLASVPRVAA
jgi:polysaccharide biosynthesis protein PslE